MRSISWTIRTSALPELAAAVASAGDAFVSAEIALHTAPFASDAVNGIVPGTIVDAHPLPQGAAWTEGNGNQALAGLLTPDQQVTLALAPE